MGDPANIGVGVKALMVKTESLALGCCKGKDLMSVFIRRGQGNRTDAINVSVSLRLSYLRVYIHVEMRASNVRTFNVVRGSFTAMHAWAWGQYGLIQIRSSPQ
ncbi:hypothetical protein N7513_000193 [Penicillium frequentans]|nr:hypothetical protein N7513_000193 [Penicillium glabrum]